MERFVEHSLSGKTRKMTKGTDTKILAVILAIEAVMFLLAMYKGVGIHFLPVTLLMMKFTVVSFVFTSYFKADKILLLIVLVLLDLGFLVQHIQSGSESNIMSFLVKLIIALVVALSTAFIYYKMGASLSKDIMILLIMLLQLSICTLMVTSKVVGKAAVMISLGGITPFELVKVLYIFVAAGLLCRMDRQKFRILWFRLDRETLLFGHTFILCIAFLLCSELGTLMIVYFTGLIFLWIYGERRKQITVLVLLSFLGIALIWLLCGEVLISVSDKLPGVVRKTVERFAAAPHPEQYQNSYGFQATLGLEAVALGGLLGIDTERFRVALPESTNDFIFDNVIQTCGLIMGIILLLFLFTFLKRGMTIAEECKDEYQRGIVTGITTTITVEAVIHIAYNLGMFPVTGIPLYFVSQGFTAILTGMALVAILLTISSMNIRRKDR